MLFFMRERGVKSLLLILALVFGQSLALVHAYEHPVLEAQIECDSPLHVQGLDTAALSPGVPACVEQYPWLAAVRLPATRARYAVGCSDRIRGPPNNGV